MGKSLEKVKEHLRGTPATRNDLVFATGGSAVLWGKPLHKFMAYALADLVTQIVGQLPPEESFGVDYNRIVSAFFTTLSDGSRSYHIPPRKAFPGSEAAAEWEQDAEDERKRVCNTLCSIRGRDNGKVEAPSGTRWILFDFQLSETHSQQAKGKPRVGTTTFPSRHKRNRERSGSHLVRIIGFFWGQDLTFFYSLGQTHRSRQRPFRATRKEIETDGPTSSSSHIRASKAEREEIDRPAPARRR